MAEEAAARAREPDAELADALRDDVPRALAWLRDGELRIVGRLTEASNVTLYCTVGEPDGGPSVASVYKPIRGERPLDDFPRGTLGTREVAAYAVSSASGWRVVPPTVMRDGPLGRGMVQLWIDVDPEADVLEMILTRDPRLRPMALFDAVVENGDRKGGHVLPASDGHLYGCDHGVCFSVEPKLRTVLWGWRGEALLDDEVACLRVLRAKLDGELGHELGRLLAPDEVEATAVRVDRLLARGRFPVPDPVRPVIPWPPF